MEIDQYLYDLNDKGEAIVAYRMSATNGGYVEVCNLAASVLSWSVPNGEGKVQEIASGRCVRGLRGMTQSDVWGGVHFEEQIWESRVEVNRVVMSLSWESDGVGMMSEVVFDYDDDNTLEITYIACADAPYEIDLTHKLHFTFGTSVEDAMPLDVTIRSDVAVGGVESIYPLRCARRSILQDAATMCRGGIEISAATSQAEVYFDAMAEVFAPINGVTGQGVEADERYVSKSVYRVGLSKTE